MASFIFISHRGESDVMRTSVSDGSPTAVFVCKVSEIISCICQFVMLMMFSSGFDDW